MRSLDVEEMESSSKINLNDVSWCMSIKNVSTLALGSRPRQRGCKSAGQEEAGESHHILLGM